MTNRRTLALSLSIALASTLVACGGDDSSSVTTPDTSAVETGASPTNAPMPPTSSIESDVPESGTPPTESLYLEVDLENDAPVDASTALGSPVTIVVTSDVEHEYHLHGYDIELTGTTVTFEFVADKAGDFELETHDTGEVVVNLQVIPD